MAQIKSTHQLTSRASELTAGVIKDFLDRLSPDALVTVSSLRGNPPASGDQVTMSADMNLPEDAGLGSN